MKKNKQLVSLMVDLLKDGPLTSRDILDGVNDRLCWGSTMNAITNVLAKRPQFERLDVVRAYGLTSTYNMVLWQLAEGYGGDAE